MSEVTPATETEQEDDPKKGPFVIKDWSAKRFRPVDALRRNHFKGEIDEASIERFDESSRNFLPDDGKPALAFVLRDAEGMPYILTVDVPLVSNILTEWRDPDGTFHRTTRDGKADYGVPYIDHRNHGNFIAYRAANERATARFGGYSQMNLSLLDGPKDRSKCPWCANGGLQHRREKLVRDVERGKQQLGSIVNQIKTGEDQIRSLRGYLGELGAMVSKFEAELVEVQKQLRPATNEEVQ